MAEDSLEQATDEAEPAKGSLAWIHKYNMGSPIFGDPDAMNNTRSFNKDLFPSMETVKVMLDGEEEEVMIDPEWGPLILQIDQTARIDNTIRDGASWRKMTSSQRKTRIHITAKKNKAMREKVFDYCMAKDWGLPNGYVN
mmetsp:Transcript_42257/g.65919  ORF Transcript_42257/g.65919 Transcript_42257/m.65919 type:complete len:140 (+) Transcript_42257:61-480(+)